MLNMALTNLTSVSDFESNAETTVVTGSETYMSALVKE